MNRLFWHFALLVLLSITVATGAIFVTFTWMFGDPLDDIGRRQAAGQIFLLEQYIDKAPADEWLVRLNKVREVAGVTLELLPLQAALAALPASQGAALRRGEIVIDARAKEFYRRVDADGARYVGSDADVIRAQHLPIDIGQALGMEAIRFGVITLCLLVPIGWWTQAHWRNLLALSRVADDFGRGNLAARATLKPTSSIAPLAERINDMAERIGLLLEARKHMLHAVSHELRTPIARLEFGLELLRHRHGAGNAALAQRIDAMEDDVAELKTLVSELLGLTQLDHAQALPRTAFALAPLLQGCVPGAQHFSADIAGDLGDMVGDPRLLARAINNLLANAAKYAAAQIALSAKRAGPHVRIVIEDDGLGIPAEARERVFEPFHRLAREQDHANHGYGLGLAIALRAVELHGGTIAIDDSPLGGARFTLTLPATPPPDAPAGAKLVSGPGRRAP